jgi:WXG100 family type VII secretion target
MDVIKVDTNRLNSDAGQIQNSIRQIETAMSNLKSDAAQLNRMWDGPSSEAFIHAFNNDMAALSSLLLNFRHIYDYEMNAKQKYEKCESRAVSLVEGIHI